MKKIILRHKLLLTFIIGLTIFFLLFFSIKYNFNISFILKDVFYFPINVVDIDSDSNLLIEGINSELKEECDDLKALLKLNESLSDFSLVNATVINRNTSYWNDELIINKGKNSGIEEGMAVIDGYGLIGSIIKTSLTTSTIKLITNNSTNNKISVKLWVDNISINKILEQDENSKLVISGIDNSIIIKEGDLVTTSGLSDIYPSGIIIGTVEKIDYDKFGISKKVYIKHSGDLDNIRFVSVLIRGIK